MTRRARCSPPRAARKRGAARRASAWAPPGARRGTGAQFERVLDDGARRARAGHGGVRDARHADRRAGAAAHRRRPDRVQPQPRHVARALRLDHHARARYDDRLQHARARARAPASRCAAAASSAWASRSTTAAGCCATLANLDPHAGERADQRAGRGAGHAARGPPAGRRVRARAHDRDGAHRDAARARAAVRGPHGAEQEAQLLCFLAGANSIFFGEKLLTTGNPERDEDLALLESAGLRPLPA